MPESSKPSFREVVRSGLGFLRVRGRKDQPEAEPLAIQFPLADYRYFKDGLQQLQQGSHYDPKADKIVPLVLPRETQELSSNIGHTGNLILLETIGGLRERRVNEQGQPYILCVDEVSDTQVLQGAALRDREQFVAEAISNTVNLFNFPTNEYLTGAVVATAVLTGREIASAKELVGQVVVGGIKDPEREAQIYQQLQNLPIKRVKNLLSFIKGSKQRLINEEAQYRFKHGPGKYASFQEAYEASMETGEPLFSLEGKEFKAPASQPSREQYILSSEEARMVQPLREAVHQSRQEMVIQARLMALRYLGLEPDSSSHAPNPPEWWLKDRGKGEGLRSDEVLVFVPYRALEDKRVSYPGLLSNFRGGWYLLKIPYDSDNNLQLKVVSELHN